jgi:4-cresol dehydrogenase (hydroxylating)
MPQPEVYKPCWIKLARDEDLAALIDAVRPLVIDRTIPNYPGLLSALAVASIAMPRAALYDGPGLVPQEAVDAFAAKADLGMWNMRFALYGTPAVVDDAYRRVAEAIANVPGARLEGTAYPGDDLPVETFDQSAKVQAGIPDMQMKSVADWWGPGGGHVGFASMTPLTGRDVRTIVDLVRNGLHSAGVDFTTGGILGPRSFILITLMIYELDDPARAERTWEICRTMIPAAARLGYGEYRAHPTMMDMVADQFDFNDHAQRRFNERIKDALDPAGILMPGKQGIWAQRDRAARADEGWTT